MVVRRISGLFVWVSRNRIRSRSMIKGFQIVHGIYISQESSGVVIGDTDKSINQEDQKCNTMGLRGSSVSVALAFVEWR